MSYRYGVAVIGNSKNIQAFHADRRGLHVGYTEQITNAGDIYHGASGTRVYYTESMEAAEALAKNMSEQYPSYVFTTFESKTVFSRPPGQLTTAVFSDKGLLPQ